MRTSSVSWLQCRWQRILEHMVQHQHHTMDSELRRNLECAASRRIFRLAPGVGLRPCGYAARERGKACHLRSRKNGKKDCAKVRNRRTKVSATTLMHLPNMSSVADGCVRHLQRQASFKRTGMAHSGHARSNEEGKIRERKKSTKEIQVPILSLIRSLTRICRSLFLTVCFVETTMRIGTCANSDECLSSNVGHCSKCTALFVRGLLASFPP